MEKLSEKEWSAFRLVDVFDGMQRGKRLKKANHVAGRVPYVSSTASANGTDGTCGNVDGVRSFEDCLTIANSGSVGSCFYHPYRFVASDHVTALVKNDASPACYLGLSVMVCRLGEKYNFNREINDFRISRERIMLPTDDAGEPDYAYMTSYANEIGGGLLMRYKSFLDGRIGDLRHVDVPALDEKEWGEFSLDELFSIGAGKRLETRNKVPGSRPFIGASETGNGVTGFVGNDNASKDSNVLGVNYNGAPCVAFYHPYECVFTDDVKRLHLKNHEDNPFALLFFATVIRQQKPKYSYGYKFKEQRMKRQKLLVPVDDSGEPDYAYMEQYAMNMMLAKYEQYLAFLDRKSESEV